MIKLTESVTSRIERAIEEGKTLTAAYVDTKGKPHISFYGSIHVHSQDTLALWVRKKESELLKTLPTSPHIALLYGDISSTYFMHFEGTASIENNEAQRDGIYRAMHPIERKFDSKMLGTAIIIKLDKVTIRTKSGSDISVRN